MATSGEKSWPPAGNFVATSGEKPMAIDTQNARFGLDTLLLAHAEAGVRVVSDAAPGSGEEHQLCRRRCALLLTGVATFWATIESPDPRPLEIHVLQPKQGRVLRAEMALLLPEGSKQPPKDRPIAIHAWPLAPRCSHADRASRGRSGFRYRTIWAAPHLSAARPLWSGSGGRGGAGGGGQPIAEASAASTLGSPSARTRNVVLCARTPAMPDGNGDSRTPSASPSRVCPASLRAARRCVAQADSTPMARSQESRRSTGSTR
jgi:hypothetical protein